MPTYLVRLDGGATVLKVEAASEEEARKTVSLQVPWGKNWALEEVEEEE